MSVVLRLLVQAEPDTDPIEFALRAAEGLGGPIYVVNGTGKELGDDGLRHERRLERRRHADQRRRRLGPPAPRAPSPPPHRLPGPDLRRAAYAECDVDELRENAARNTKAALVEGGRLEMTIDGELVEDVSSYRAKSPETFVVALPDNNILGLTPGIYEPHIADGFWLFLTPFSTGEHVIEISVVTVE
jgi:hypothetical protein